MRFQEIDLDLEFVGVGPVVVALACGNVFGTGVDGSIHDAEYGSVVFAMLVFGLVDGFDDVRELLSILADDGGGAVRRGVVVNDGLEGEGRLLHHESVQALTQERLVIIDQTLNGN
jgi:hypothetical protein